MRFGDQISRTSSASALSGKYRRNGRDESEIVIKLAFDVVYIKFNLA